MSEVHSPEETRTALGYVTADALDSVWLVGISTILDDLIVAAFATEEQATDCVRRVGRKHSSWLEIAVELAGEQFNADVSDVTCVWIGRPGLSPREIMIADDSFED